jgi:hypothetical protein
VPNSPSGRYDRRSPTQWEPSMEKTIIAGVAALLLSAGVAVAQSNSDQSSMSAGTSASAGIQSNSDTATAPKKVRSVAARYPKAEAKLNREEAQQTKQLNMQESQEVASNSGSSSQPQ